MKKYKLMASIPLLFALSSLAEAQDVVSDGNAGNVKPLTCGHVSISGDEQAGWACLSTKEFVCTSMNCKFNNKNYFILDRISKDKKDSELKELRYKPDTSFIFYYDEPDDSTEWSKKHSHWKPTKAQEHPEAYAKASAIPLDENWRCDAEKCAAGEAYPGVLIPKDVAVIDNAFAYCGSVSRAIDAKNLNEYQCIGGKLLCENPRGCAGEMPDKLGLDGEMYGLCKNGQCACGDNFCGQNQTCIDGNCWFNGQVMNGAGDFSYKLVSSAKSEWMDGDEDDPNKSECSGSLWVNDNMDDDHSLVAICCYRKGGCWTTEGIHYPQYACIGYHDEMAHNDTDKPSQFGRPMNQIAQKREFCNQKSCVCGTNTCVRGQLCVEGECQAMSCSGQPKDIKRLNIDHICAGKGGDRYCETEGSSVESELQNYLKCVDDKATDFCRSHKCRGKDVYIEKIGKDDSYNYKQIKFYNPKKLTKPEKASVKYMHLQLKQSITAQEELFVTTPRMMAYEELQKRYASIPTKEKVVSAERQLALDEIEKAKKECEKYDAVYTEYGCYCNGVKRADGDTKKCHRKEPAVEYEQEVRNYNVFAYTGMSAEEKNKKYFKTEKSTAYYFRFHKYYRNRFHFSAYNVTIAPNEICNVTQGCMCGASKCLMSGLCTDNGCVDPVTNQPLVESKGYITAGLYKQCAQAKGCKCGEDSCKQGEICINGYCSPEFEAHVVDGKRVISEGLECSRQSWNGIDPEQYVCYKDARVDGEDYTCDSYDESVVSTYGNPRCALPDGCACGANKCPQYAQCVAGECYYDKTYARVMCEYSDSSQASGAYVLRENNYLQPLPTKFVDKKGQCICGSALRPPVFNPIAHANPYDFAKGGHTVLCGSEDEGWICADPKGCPCGKATCSKGAVCLKSGVCTVPLKNDVESGERFYPIPQ